MKANLPEAEPRQLEDWNQKRLYDRILASRKGAPLYVLHDGPPYPTGEIHLGTALNKILKDMVVNSKTMAGFRAPYVPGWDCHGLPIETQVEKELGGKGAVAPAEFRRMCRNFASRYVQPPPRLSTARRFGPVGRAVPHHGSRLRGADRRRFLKFLEKGYVYRGLKPVYWCMHDRTALAEAEVEYEDHASPSIWVRYEVLEAPIDPERRGRLYALIWTTTPWTLPASLALAFHPDFDYVTAEDAEGNVYLLAEDRLEPFLAETGVKFTRRAERLEGRRFEGARFRHPFLDREIVGVLADYVTLDQGTGIVHTAPGHGAEDFHTGQKYGLEAYAPIDDDGRFTEGLAELSRQDRFRGQSAHHRPVAEGAARWSPRASSATAIRTAGAATIR